MQTTNTKRTHVTVAELQTHTREIMREVQGSRGIAITSEDGEILAMLAPIAPATQITPEDEAAIKQDFADSETEDQSKWMDNDEFMRQLDEDERRRQDG